MQFKLLTTGSFYSKKHIETYEKYGFKFKDYTLGVCDCKQCYQDIFIDINSLEDLMKVVDDFGEIVVTENEIEIYDDYRE